MNNFSHNMGRMVVEIIYCEIIIGLLAVLSSIMKRYIMHKCTHVVSHNMWVPQVYRAMNCEMLDAYTCCMIHFFLYFCISPYITIMISPFHRQPRCSYRHELKT